MTGLDTTAPTETSNVPECTSPVAGGVDPSSTPTGLHLAAVESGIARAQRDLAFPSSLTPYDHASVLIRGRARDTLSSALIALSYGLNQRASHALVEGYAYWLACDAHSSSVGIYPPLLQSLREWAAALDRMEVVQ